jgi:hypothetical protein
MNTFISLMSATSSNVIHVKSFDVVLFKSIEYLNHTRCRVTKDPNPQTLRNTPDLMSANVIDL